MADEPGKLIIAISDLHLGRGNKQDSFTRLADTVRDFGTVLAAETTRRKLELTLVLNGDIIDLWEIVEDAALGEGEAAYTAISNGLYVPASDAAAIQAMAKNVGSQIDAAFDKHPEFCDMLRSLTDSGANIHFNAGNHDHQLDHASTKALLLKALTSRGIGTGSGTVSFGRYFHDSDLGFYAEHGDQFAGRESRSPLDFAGGNGLTEATGFWFLRYVWNRLESSGKGHLQSPSTAQVIRIVIDIVLRRKGDLAIALDYLNDYFRASTALNFEIVDEWPIRFLFKRWLRRQDNDKSERDLDENDVQALIAENESAMNTKSVLPFEAEHVGFLTKDLGSAQALGWLPGTEIEPPICVDDTHLERIEGRFRRETPPFPRLNRSAVRTVTLGHTHIVCRASLSRTASPVYFNSGCWLDGKPLTYVWSLKVGDSSDRGVRVLR